MAGDSFELISSEFEEKLIDAVRNANCLWSKAHRDFKNSKAKEAAWKRIAELLDIEPQRCKNIWTPLRAQFMKFLLRLRKPSGSNGRRPFFRHENSMMFLRGDIEPDETNYSNLSFDSTSSQSDPLSPENVFPTDSDVVDIEISNAGSEHFVASTKDTPVGRSHSKFGGKRKLDSTEKEILKILSTEEDEFDVFGKRIALKSRKLSALNRRAYLELEHKIDSLVNEAEMENVD